MQHYDYTVHSSQTELHQHLPALVEKHLRTAYQLPISETQIAAFDAILPTMAKHSGPIILDSGCGTGMSTQALAKAYPQHLVLGIDKSIHRLARGQAGMLSPANCVFVRMRLECFWRLAREAGWQVEQHYLLYPNPWPKPGHLKRRWHAHPAFFDLLALGSRFIVRSNWKLYLDEFKLALEKSGQFEAKVSCFKPTTPLTAFEKKYQAASCPVYQLVANRLA